MSKQYKLSNRTGSTEIVKLNNNLDIEISVYNEKTDFADVFQLVHDSTKDSTGVDENEFPNAESVQKKIDNSIVVEICRDRSNGKLTGVFFTTESDLVRSTNSPLFGGYIFVSAGYRGAGLGFFFNNFMIRRFAKNSNRWGLIGRVAVTARSVLLARASNSMYLGVIPKSIRLSQKHTVVDDLIAYYDFNQWRTEEARQRALESYKEVPVMPPLSPDTRRLAKINSPIPKEFTEKVVVFHNKQNICIVEATTEDYITVEKMIRASAKEGRGFGLDEFTEAGMFNRKLLRKSYVLVGKVQPKGDIIGAVVCGGSAICRVLNKLLAGYLVLDRSYMDSGLDKILLSTLIDMAKHLNFEGLLIDVFQCESKMVSLCKEMGFHISGSLPNCAYMKGLGYVDSLLLYREFYHFKL